MRAIESAKPGKSLVKTSFDAWKEGQVLPAEFYLEIKEKIPLATPESVSLKPRFHLVHNDKERNSMGLFRYSKDGTKIFGAPYPGGIVQIWDADTGKQIRHMETGKGYRGGLHYAILSPDEKRLWVGEEKGGKHEKFKEGGVDKIRWTYHSSLRSWEIDSGKMFEPITPKDGCNFRGYRASNNGRYLIANVETSCVIPRTEPRYGSVMLIDLETGKQVTLPERVASAGYFTPDSKAVLVSLRGNTETKEQGGYELLSVPDLKTIQSYPIGDKYGYGYQYAFSPDGSRIAFYQQIMATPRGYNDATAELRILETKTGKVLQNMSLGQIKSRPTPTLSDDFRYLCVVKVDIYSPESKEMLIYNGNDLKLISKMDLPAGYRYGSLTFHPNGKLACVACQHMEKRARNEDEVILPEQCSQPRLVWFDLASAKILRTDILPPSFPGKASFSKDGKRLAVSGYLTTAMVFDVPEELLK